MKRGDLLRRLLRAFLPLVAIVFVAMPGSFLQGYATVGHTWPTNTVTYYVNPQSIYVSPSAAISAAQLAASGWSTQTGANINLVYGGTTGGSSLTANNKNEVFFRNGSNGANVAETYYWWDASGRLFDADIVMYEGAFQFFTGSGCVGGVYVEDVLIHEFGHVLGLAHSSVAGATMAPSMPTYCDLTQLTLEADDISGIRSLYPPTGNPPPNTAPSVTISSPANLASFAATTSITFTGSATDTQDGNLSSRLTWVSNLSGTIGSGGSFSRTLPAGTHIITASASDNGGLSGSASITVTVSASAPPANTAPVITILSPADGGVYAEGTPITFSGTAIDVQDGDLSNRLWWTSSISGELGSGASFTKALPAGSHLIGVQVGDNGGLASFKQISIVVASGSPPPPPTNTPPDISILSPLSSGSYVAGTPITFSGSAIDAQDGDLSSRLWWTSTLSGELGSGASFTRSLVAGTHTIGVQVGDNGGLASFKQVTIVVAASQSPPANTPPAVTILSPLAAGTYTDATSITFSGSAIDVPDGDVSSRLVWTSNVSGVIGTGATFTRTLVVGTHTITASATDNNNQSGFGQVTITVTASQPPPAPPPSSSISLTARGYKVRGYQRTDLTWSGATSSSVDVYRNGARIATTANSGAWTDQINLKGAASYVYKVCNSGTSTCSSDVTVTF